MRNSFHKVGLLFCVILSGCATFQGPELLATDHALNLDTDLKYLDEGVSRLDKAAKQAENAKFFLEVPILLTAVAAPTAVAMGASTNVAIVGAGVAATGAGGSNYLQPRQRMGYIFTGEDALQCVRRELLAQYNRAIDLGLITAGQPRTFTATSELSSYPMLAGEVTGSGDIAVGAAGTIIGKVRARLAGLGTVPDYAAIVENLQKEKMAATTTANAAKAQYNLRFAALTPAQQALSEQTIDELASYSTKIDACVAKVQ